ncbi:MAG: M10 family metallopeptidase C-terminal domain-containing protein [Rhodobacteraceae bacterium]|nr:M10 family metallopeptidase C-terminal domain-containing protein [Paracoccaceae bacterium]
MTKNADIIEAMQFTSIFPKDAINTTGSGRETITWQYAGTSAPDDLPTSSTYTGWTAFEAAEKAAFEAVLAHFETFLNVDFVEVTGSDDPDLNVGNVTLAGSLAGVGGISFFSSGTTISSLDSYVVYDNTLDLSLDAHTDLLLHEMGHALGLKHPFSNPGLPTGEDSNKYTVMSYTDNPDNGEVGDAMMLYDLLALQDIWGGADYHADNSRYTGSRTDTVDTVWDTGGTDIFDAGAKTTDVTLDLGQGKFSMFGTYEDVVIAYGTNIENAKGGSGDDTITGNILANVLNGGKGNDTISGGDKGDTLKGGAGKDTLSGDQGSDTLIGGGGRDTLQGGSGKDALRGGGGHDKLKGGGGNDTLKGQAGNDKLWGNGGADRFVFGDGDGKDTIKDFQDNIDEIRIVGQGSETSILARASDVGGDVVIDFGGGDILTIQNTTVAEITDDILT